MSGKGNCYDNFILSYAEGAMVEACPMIHSLGQSISQRLRTVMIIGCCALQSRAASAWT
jgi:hypothetical protein